MDSFVLVIFGITSNLAQIKLIPALYDIAEKNLLPENTTIIGIARKPKSKEDFSKYVLDVLSQENRHHMHIIKDEVTHQLVTKMHYLDGDVNDPALYKKINEYLKQLKKEGKNCQNKIFYLATYPDVYENIFKNLKSSNLSSQTEGWVRLMVEKPIGTDFKSSKKLNNVLTKYFTEDQIFRLDHYLGKETLQNIITFRFGNDVFEPLINKDYIDHIQITAAENFGIGQRGGYYDSVGAFKDFAQNHILQMIALATMECPSDISNEAITKERLKILENLVPIPNSLILGQYEGYTKEPNVNLLSKQDTYYAFKTQINNERFKGVPIYVRGGKNLKETVTEIAIVFKTPVNRLFKRISFETEGQKIETALNSNILIYRIQPNEGIVLKILSKKPGFEMEMEQKFMEFCYRPDMKTTEGKEIVSSHFLLDPYERLLFDAIKGDQTFFNDAEEVEAEWAFTDKMLNNRPEPFIYKPGSWGPEESDNLIKETGHEWIEPSMDFCRI